MFRHVIMMLHISTERFQRRNTILDTNLSTKFDINKFKEDFKLIPFSTVYSLEDLEEHKHPFKFFKAVFHKFYLVHS